MSERVIYTPEADDDIAESYGWYENREPGLGEDFLRCVEACVVMIQRHPQIFPVAVDEFRQTTDPLAVWLETAPDHWALPGINHASSPPSVVTAPVVIVVTSANFR